MMYQLYGMTGAASLAPHMILEAVGAPYQFIKLDGDKKEHKTSEYLKLNPHGRVPTLVHNDGVHGDTVIYEAAAICLYIAELAQSSLLPPVATPARGQLYKWMMFLTNTVQPALMAYFYPDRYTTEAAHAPAIKEKAEQNAMEYFHQLDRVLAEHGPYLLGNDESVADYFALMLIRWGRWFATPPVKQFVHLAHFVERMSAKPAVQRAFAQEGIPAPYCLLPAK